ncbi:hypothetical protein GINT2_000571 [Glugoides intestinalis]
MTKNKRINPEDYEAAFLFKHFVASCHQQESKFYMSSQDSILIQEHEAQPDETYKESATSSKEDPSAMHNASMFKSDDAEIFRIVPESWEDQQSSSHQSKSGEGYSDESTIRKQDNQQKYYKENIPFKGVKEGESWTESKDPSFTDYSESAASVAFRKKNLSADMEKKTEKKPVASNELEHSHARPADAAIAGFVCVYCRGKFFIKRELVDHLLEAHALKE